jgi:hypothetical protein
MGGLGCDLFQFNLVWHQVPGEKVKKIKNHETQPYVQDESPRLARTVDEAPPILPPQKITRVNTPGERPLEMRYTKVGVSLNRASRRYSLLKSYVHSYLSWRRIHQAH